MTKKDTKRYLKPDHKYESKMVSKFINKIMLDGKKTIAEKIVYNSLEELSKNVSEDPLKAFQAAIDNIAPEWKSDPDVLVDQLTRFQLKSVKIVC